MSFFAAKEKHRLDAVVAAGQGPNPKLRTAAVRKDLAKVLMVLDKGSMFWGYGSRSRWGEAPSMSCIDRGEGEVWP